MLWAGIKRRITSQFPYRHLHTLNKDIMKRNINTNVTLNDTETKVSSLLMEFCNEYNKNLAMDQEPLELRITGGWVRDKLLGLESHDLDIAINHLSGEEFAEKLVAYTSAKYPDLELKGIHKIKKNPEKSKHLETCTTKLFGIDIDFVNLRSEQYTSDSRVPIIECGTAEEDSLRRDATLNALFYNLNQKKVEDFTKKGIQDLANGILRTPLQPLQTFLDDPLRVLRLIRFASRFNFIIDPKALEAMTNEELKDTLLHKISRERIGVELDKILTSSNSQYGLRLLNHVGLTDSIFSFGALSKEVSKLNEAHIQNKLSNISQEVDKQLDICTAFWPIFSERVKQVASPILISNFEEIENQYQRLIWLTLILYPYGDLKIRCNTKKMGLQSAVETIIKEGLRFGKHDHEPAAKAIAWTTPQNEKNELIHQFFKDPNSVTRSQLGLYFKEGAQYAPLILIIQCFLDILPEVEFEKMESQPLPDSQFTVKPSTIKAIDTTLDKYSQLFATIYKLNLQDIHNTFKPIVDGKLLLAALQKKPGPWLKNINEQVVIWQLDHPEGTSEECIQHIKEILPNYT